VQHHQVAAGTGGALYGLTQFTVQLLQQLLLFRRVECAPGEQCRDLRRGG